MRTLAALIALALAGCQTAPKLPSPPTVVKVPVEVFKPLPAWATEPLPNTPPADASVGALVRANNARAEWLDYANCRARLLRALDEGREADPKTCRKP